MTEAAGQGQELCCTAVPGHGAPAGRAVPRQQHSLCQHLCPSSTGHFGTNTPAQKQNLEMNVVWAVQGGGSVPIPEGIQGKTGCGTQCSSVVDKGAIGQRLVSMILEVSSSLNDSVNKKQKKVSTELS